MLDKLILHFDHALRTLTYNSVSQRKHPDENIAEAELTNAEKKHVIGLIRIDHCGEVCAQALYQGQALTSRKHKQELQQAALEETEHLAWTKRRLEDLAGRTSYLTPLFYLTSLNLGIAAGILGDKWNLGFLEETEQQVTQHLTEHLTSLPEQDAKSKAILSQMREDEMEHATMAHNAGAAKLPAPIKKLMRLSSKLMTKTTYYI